jgi:pyruvate ferredoxin oxidoreductase beta subunit/2-oxoisovalerate ferredoxin oxidoreductase beta subunit
MGVMNDLLCSGHAACPGCIEALSLRHALAALGPDTVAVIPPSCLAIMAGPQPLSGLRIPVYQPALATSAASASGLRRALDALGKKDTQVVVFAGDGGTYDIGFQALSSAAERNEDILYVCFDNEGYMNTGAQKSSSTPHFARTGSTPAGKLSKKKNLTAIMAAHEIPYAATAAAGYLPDFLRKVEKAKSIRGFRLITLLVPCLDGWGVPEDQGLALTRLAVEAGVFPLYEVEDGYRTTLNGPAKSRPVRDYLEVQRRYRDLDDASVQTLQREVDEGWARLLARL